MGNNLVVYAQPAWHDDVVIVGNTSGLLALKHAIEIAIENNSSAEDMMLPMDGEGYSIKIIKVGNDTLNTLPVPYYEEIAKETDINRLNVLDELTSNISRR